MKKICHVLLLKVSSDKQHRVDQFLLDLDALRFKMDGFLTLSGGANVSEEGLDGGYTHGVVMTFSDAATLDQYMKHPDHLAIVDSFLPDFEKIVVIDYTLH